MLTRFAPSPTGYLHLGHARAAKEAFNFASQIDDECLLRIEDTDHTRCKTEFTQMIYQDLDWLGFDWRLPVRVQSHNYPSYAKVVIDLIKRGLAYGCVLTRGDIKDGEFPSPDHSKWESESLIKRLWKASQDEKPNLPFAIRLNLKRSLKTVAHHALTFEDLGPLYTGQHQARPTFQNTLDPIIARKDIGCSYMIAGPHDDWEQNISHVVRGADLFHETPLQVLLQALMDWPTPKYYHHGLVTSEAGDKLSKRNLDTTLKSLREAGQTPNDIWELVK